MILSVTGHRPHLLGGYGQNVTDRLEHLALVTLAARAPRLVCTGVALGWDQVVASACVSLGIPFVAVLPSLALNGSIATRWPVASRARYERLLHAASEIEVLPFAGAGREFASRDWRLAERCDEMLALWNGDEQTGTGRTVRMCGDQHKPVVNLWDAWRAL